MTSDTIPYRPPRSWQKVSIIVDACLTEAVTAFLSNLTGSGLEISVLENEREPFGPAVKREQITAYLPVDPENTSCPASREKITEIGEFIKNLDRFFSGCSEPVLQLEAIVEEDWGKKWKSFFSTFHITPRLIIKPSWEKISEPDNGFGADKLVIELDPGLAFGTGHHASTRLALLMLEELFLKSGRKVKKVLDVGTGSGILAMACGLYGADEVVAVDTDPDAVAAAKENIDRNKMSEIIAVSGEVVASLEPGFDIVVANITHDILTELAATLVLLLNPGSFLVLSGILQGDQAESIVDKFNGLGLDFLKKNRIEEWAALLFQKK